MPKIMHAEDAAPGRGGRPRRISTSLAEINVVPLVDVMLVLLIIFMVTAPMMQRGVDVKLPTSRRASPMSSQRVTVTVPLSYRKDQRVLLGENDKEENVRIDLLAERVRQAMVSQTEKQVFLRLDAGITAQEFMNVIDRLKEAGVENIGLPTEFP